MNPEDLAAERWQLIDSLCDTYGSFIDELFDLFINGKITYAELANLWESLNE